VAEPRDLFEGSMASMGPYVSLPEVIGLYTANPAAFNAASGDEIVRLEARKYDISEDILSGYAMGSTKFGKLEVIGGARWEQTKTSYTWLADPAGASSGSKNYNDLFPSALLNYRFNDKLVLRFAYTNTLARPSYGDLVPYRVLADTQADTGNGGLEPGDYPETSKVYLGNANLKAQKSQNFDLSFEYYIKQAGLFSVALFHKDLSDVIYRSQFKDPALPNTIYFQDRNGSKGKVDGVEVSWQQALTFLPGPLSGLGVNLNFTYTKGSSDLQELVPGSTSTYRTFHVDFLPEQPKKVYNAQVWWEKYGFTGRVAVNYVDTFVRTSGGLTSFSVNNSATRVDASVSYRINRNLTLYVEGKNLTREIDSWYATSPNRPEDYTFNGMTFNGGVKFRF
jgi:TonB-dependent receptor